MTLVMSLIAAVMVTAISRTIIVEEDELLQFAVDSGELIIRRMLDMFQFSYVCILSGNRATLTVVLRPEPLPEVGTSNSPDQRDPPSSPTPVERTRSPQPHTILYPGYPFRLCCPLCPRRLEFLEYCHHSEHGLTVLRRHPANPEDSIVSRQEIHDHPFLFLRFVPGPRHTFPHPNPENPNQPRRFSRVNRPLSSNVTTVIDEAIRTAIAQETPPHSNSSSSQQSFTVFLPRNDEPNQRNSPEPPSLPEGQLHLRQGNGSLNYGLTRASGRSSTRGRASATSRGRVSVHPVLGTSTRRNQQVPSADGHTNVQNLRHGGSHRGNHQVRGLPALEGRELQTACHVVFPFQIRPCETRVRSLQMINSFMYRKETITAAYEGAGWAFPVETYRNTPHTRVHFQGFEILRRMHFPPTLVPSQVLAESLEPNWLPPTEVMADEWGFVKRTEAPYLAEWNEAFNSYHRFLFRRDPAYKSQRRLQCLFKSTQTQNELDAIYEGLKERPHGRRNRRAVQEGERLRRVLKHC
jgi:hypothetical protein